MSDVISRSAVLETLCNGCNSRNNMPVPRCGDMCIDFKEVLKLPALDVEPVVHARWGEAEVVGYDGIRVIYGFPCGRCGKHVRHIGCNWCPWCGAKMDATSNVPETNVGMFGGVINAVD